MSEHLDEIGAELDQMIRSSVMAVSQMGEQIARRTTDQRQAATAAAREQFLTARDSARATYLPLTQDRAGERATPAQLHQGWTLAQQWAPRDPQAAAAAEAIAGRFTDRFGVGPDQVRPGTWQRETTDVSPTAQPLTRDEAAQLAQQHAPGYYTRHLQDRTDVPDGQLEADWEQWREQGDLPTQSVREEWARHVDQLDDARAARDAAAPQDRDAVYAAALEQSWASSAQLGDQQIVSLAQEHAPAWYQRHHDDALATDEGAAQLRTDWEHWRDHGQLPIAARHEEWAAYVGQADDFAPDLWSTPEERDAALQQVWDEGHDERGLLDMTQHLQDIRDANLDTKDVTTDSLSTDLEQFRLDQQAARDVYTPLLDPSTFAAADQATALRAWEQAAGWAGQDPAAEAAASQLDQQFRTRWNTSPMEYLLDHIGDQTANATENQRAAHALEVAAAERAEADQLRGTAQDTLDTPHAAEEREEADQQMERADDLDSAAARAQKIAPYNRADEANMDAPGVTDEAREARIQSAAGFSRSTDDMLARHAGTLERAPHAAPAKATLGRTRGSEHDLGR